MNVNQILRIYNISYSSPSFRALEEDLGVINQCIAPMNMKKVNDQYLTNVALKINVKVFNQVSMINISSVYPFRASPLILYVDIVGTVVLFFRLVASTLFYLWNLCIGYLRFQ